MNSVSDAFVNLLDQLLSAIPVILAFALIVLVGYLVARTLRRATGDLLERFGLDRSLHENEYGLYAERLSPGASPTRLIASAVFWFVLLGAVAVAIAYTGNPGLTIFLDGVIGYLPKVIAAVLIFVVAGVISAAVGGFVRRTMGDTATGQVVQAVVPVLVMGIAIFMMLDQLEIAPDVVRIGFTALVGALALALALAFGLGGRDVAGQIVRDAYDKAQERRGEVRADYELAKERGRQDVERVREEHEERAGSRAGGASPVEPGAGEPSGPAASPPPEPSGSALPPSRRAAPPPRPGPEEPGEPTQRIGE